MRSHVGFTGGVVRPVYFVDIDFESGMFRANSSDRSIVFGGHEYFGVGNLGQISEYNTTTGTVATAIKLTLTAIPPEMTMDVAEENTRNRRVNVSIGLVDEAYALLAPPYIFFTGNTDTLSMDIGRMTTIQLSATSRLINWARSINTRYTNEDQQSQYPGDTGFQFVNKLMTLKLQWGS
ncbi:MAG: hypothetical protein JWR85_4172 [Marmoricola sp.]|nr:hypothetical protein [Marmoricola sp.]